MLNKPLVSIALCTYNGSAHIEAQLKSIINQTYQNLEIIICDDRSTDDTVEKLRKYTVDSRVHLHINDETLGVEENFYRAIVRCHGEFISLSDQDDLWVETKIEELLTNIGDHQLIYSDSDFIDDNGNFLNKKLSDLRTMYSGHDNRVFAFYFIGCVYGHTVLFRSGLKTQLEPRPPIYHDGWIAFIATCQGSIYFYDKVLTHYRQHAASFTSNSVATLRSRFEKFAFWIVTLREYSNNPQQHFFSMLEQRFIKNPSIKASLNFIGFCIKNRNVLFFTKQGFFSRINLIRKLLLSMRA